MNLKKTALMNTEVKINICSDVEAIRTVTNYKFLVVLITNDSYTSEETKKRICLSKAAMANLTKIIKSWKFQPTQQLSCCRQQYFQQCCLGAAKESR